jgi:biopolymer transport protein ExbD
VKLRARRAEEPEINLISLIDIVLMLVIFLMFSSQFVDEGRLRIKLPEASQKPAARDSTSAITLVVTQGGTYRLNDRELVNSSAETLRAGILKIAAGDRALPVTVRADGRATHQSVVTAMDVLARLGFQEIDIATVREGNAAPAPEAAGAGRR